MSISSLIPTGLKDRKGAGIREKVRERYTCRQIAT